MTDLSIKSRHIEAVTLAVDGYTEFVHRGLPFGYRCERWNCSGD